MMDYFYPEGSSTPRVIVVLEYPAIEEIRENTPFTNQYTQRIKDSLITRGFVEDDIQFAYLCGQIYYASGTYSRKPTPEEIAENAPDTINHIRMVMTLSNLTHIIPVGANVTSHFLGEEISFTEEVGKEHEYPLEVPGTDQQKKMYVIPLTHPIAAEKSDNLRRTFNSAIDSIYAAVYEMNKIDNAEYIGLEKMGHHLQKLIKLYKAGKIDGAAYDSETNSLDVNVSYFKIALVSVHDKLTNKAYATAVNHPEVLLSPVKQRLFKLLFDLVDAGAEIVDDDQFRDFSVKIDRWLKLYRSIEFMPRKEVFSEVEDRILLELGRLSGVLAYKRKFNVADKIHLYAEVMSACAADFFWIQDLMAEGLSKPQVMAFYQILDEFLATVPLVGHNLKYDVTTAHKFNLGLNSVKVKQDTYGQAVQLFMGLNQPLDLESLAMKHANMENGWKTQFHANPRLTKRLHGDRFDRVPLRVLGPYSAADGLATHMLEDALDPQIDKVGLRLLCDMQNAAVPAFSYGEIHGFTVDKEIWDALYENYNNILKAMLRRMGNLPTVKRFQEDCLKTLNNKTKEYEVSPFNPNVNGAPSHKARVLFGKEYLGLRSIASTDQGYPSCDAKTMTELMQMCKESINRYEKYAKEIGELDEFHALSHPRPFCANDMGVVIDAGRYERLKEALKLLTHLKKHAEFSKLTSTYVNNIGVLNKKTGVVSAPPIHFAEFNLIGATATGRLSSGFHTLPKKSDVKKMYMSAWGSNSRRQFRSVHEPIIPGTRYKAPDSIRQDGMMDKIFMNRSPAIIINRKLRRSIQSKRGGGLILYGDFSQLELRILCAVAQDPDLLAAFNSGQDFHSTTAKMVFPQLADVDISDIKTRFEDLRSAAKIINFAIIYGRKAESLGPLLGISVEQAQEYIDFWMKRFAKVAQYIREMHECATTNGYVVDAYGRIRWIPDAQLANTRENRTLINHAMNQAQNSPIQSSASTLAFDSARRIQESFRDEELFSIMLGGVHDSILDDIYPQEMANAIRICDRECTKYPSTLDWIGDVPIEFDQGIGVSWGRVMEFGKLVVGDDSVRFTLKGGNVEWRLIQEQLEIGYDGMFQVHSYDETGERKIANEFIEQSDRDVKVDLELAYLK